nr:MAG TPA: hypothetical protein [Caudoviricetes sp.]
MVSSEAPSIPPSFREACLWDGGILFLHTKKLIDF